MISYWVDATGRFGIGNYLATRGASVAARFAVRLYEDLAPAAVVQGGGHIFSALDVLTPAGRALAAELWDRIGEAGPEWARLNDPRRVRLRTELLRAAAAEGLNDFRVWPAHGQLDAVRYPVFVRMANRHTGSLTGLLDSSASLRQALRALRFRGVPLSELLVVEYVHTADEQGRFRKYSAYRIGTRLVRAHLFNGHSWALKAAGNEPTLACALELREYVAGDQHEAWLRQVFELARIDYGRVDYGVAGGRPQLWEINLTPWLARRAGEPRTPAPPEVSAVQDEARAVVHEAMKDAFLALDRPDPPAAADVRLPAALVHRLHEEVSAAERRQARLAALVSLFGSGRLGRPVRALYRKLLPRR